MKKFTILLVALLSFAVLFTGCGGQDTPENTKVKVGVVGTNEEGIWKFLKEKLAPEGIDLEIVVFTDYNQPNDALDNGNVDINAFQHYIFLESYNKAKEKDLTVIGETFISPLGLYSQKIKDVSEIKEGDKIAIPNDPTNGGRALLLLQSANLISVDPEKGDTPTKNDIIENKLNLEILELDASQTARSLPDVAASVINGGMAVDAGINPPKDSIFIEKLTKTSKPYINIIVSRSEDKDSEVLQKIVKAYREEDTAKVVQEETKGACIPVWNLE